MRATGTVIAAAALAAAPRVINLLKFCVIALALALPALGQAVTLDITNQFTIVRSGLVFNRITSTFDSTVKLTNAGGAPVLAPISVVVPGLPTAVTLANKVGLTADGKPYVSPMAAGTQLASGSTLTFVLKFANPTGVAFGINVQVLYSVDVPADAPVLFNVVSTGPNDATLLGRADGVPSQLISLQLSSAAVCVAGTLVGGAAVGAPVATMTDSNGYFAVAVSGITPGSFVTAKLTAPRMSPPSLCQVAARDNDSWPKAFPIDATLNASDLIDLPGKARWYRFAVTPGQRIQVSLTNLPADYDLAVFKDISQAFLSQFDPAKAGVNDLLKLSAEYAPSIFSPSIFSPSIFSPDAYAPSIFSPSIFSPSIFSPSIFSPSIFSTSIFTPSIFSPSIFSPSIFSPSIFSPSIFSPSIFSSTDIAKAFSTAQSRTIIAVSATPGTASEFTVVNTWNSTGNFYVRVIGRNGAFNTTTPFVLNVVKGPTTCTGVTDLAISSRSRVPAAGLSTVILTDSSVVALDDPLLLPGGGTLRDRLNALAGVPQFPGVTIDVAGDARVTALKAQAAANPACPFAKNLVAQEIKGIVDSYRDNPLRYVVIIGSDSAIPFFRSPDQSGLGEESGFVPPVQSNSPSEASLRRDFVLSQDDYGSGTTLSLPGTDFAVPGLAVGRLVETPTEIAGIIDAAFAANGVVSPSTSLVTGYDFLADAADAVRTELQAGTGGVSDALITPKGVSPQDPASWTATQLGQALLVNRHDVIFLAGHFSANSALAADFATSLLTTDLAASSVDLTNSVVFSAGCHSGYNLVDSDAIPGVTLQLDWAQSFARKHATLIAGTGYQYGDTDFVEYDERLYKNFARELRAGNGPISVGEALVSAKLDYLAATPDIRGIHEKALREVTLFGLPMLGVNMPAGRGAVPPNQGVITPVPVSAGPAATLGLETYNLSVAPNLTSANIALKSVSGGPDVIASWLNGPDGVVSKPGEPVLPLAVVNVTPTDQTVVLRGVGFRGGTYADSAPMLPFSGSATTELRGVHVPFVSPVFYPSRMWSPNYFGALAGSGGTQLLVTPAQHRIASLADGTSTERKFTNLDLKLFYSGNLSQAALSDAPSIVAVSDQKSGSDVVFSVQVVGDPAAAIHQVWITYTSDASATWTSLDLSQCVAPLAPDCSSEDSRLWTGRLVSAPVNLKYVVQAVSGIGLVALDDNRGAYYGIVAAAPAATTLALVSPPTSAAVGDTVAIKVKLADAGVGLAGKIVTISVGGAAQIGITTADGTLSINMRADAAPDSYSITASFAGDDNYLGSSATAPFQITQAPSALAPLLPSGAVLTGTLGGKVQALQQEAVSFSVTGPSGSIIIWANTDELGQAMLPPPGLPAGNYSVTGVSFAGDSTFAPAALMFAPAQQFVVGKVAQTIAFGNLPDISYGAPAFGVYAIASSGLPVSFTASGACSVAGNSVQVSGVGTCTVTAMQDGDPLYAAAPAQARTFTISSAAQVITFGPAPIGVTVGQPLVFVTATSSSPTSAPSTMPIAFTSLTPTICATNTTLNNLTGVDLLAPGQCIIAANQVGSGPYSDAAQQTLSFAVAAAGSPPAVFTVTNLNDRGAGSLRSAITSANATAPGPNIVNFAQGLTGTIVLTTGQIQISRAVTIDGPGSDVLTIDGNGNSRIFSIFATSTACPALEPGPDYLVFIRRLRLTNAAANFVDSFGGAIYTGHSLLLDSVTIDNSSARSGGGVGFDLQYPGQAIAINDAQFLNNIATPAVPPVSFPNSSGGALNFSERCGILPTTTPVSVTILNSLFSGNRSQPLSFSALGRGGAIAASSLADIAIVDTRIVGNRVDAPNPPVAGQTYYGGGLSLTAKSLLVLRSEIAENSANDVTGADITRGGGLLLTNNTVNLQGPGNAMAARIINSTISNNFSSATAGAMRAFGNVTVELDNSTMNGNSAAPGRTGGILVTTGATNPASAANATAPTLTVVSSILANNSPGVDVSTSTAVIPTFSVNAFNSLIQNPCSTCAMVVSGPGSVVGADPIVGPLGFNGGLTQTHALLAGSPALAAGSNPLALTTDQRGLGFPRVAGVAADMGAYEASLSLPIAGGTYFDRSLGLIGTAFVSDPITIAGTLPSVNVVGPPAWNGGNPLSCVLYQPAAMQPTDPAAPFAYFATAAGKLLVVDTATNVVAATVTVGTNPYAAVVNRGGSRVYVSNFGSNSVSVIDTFTNAVIATIPVGAGPQGLAVSPSGTRMYVASFTAGTVSVIDAGTNSVITTIPAAGAVDVVVNHAGTRLYVAYGAGVAVVDTATNLVTGSIPRGALSTFGSIAISRDDARLYAWADGSASVAVIDIGTSSVVAAIPISAPFANDGIAVHPSGAPVYLSTGSNVSVIDPVTNTVSATVALGTTGGAVNGVAVTADGTRVYVATANGVRTFDTATSTVSSIPTGAVGAMGLFVGSGPKYVRIPIANRSICWTFTLPITGSYTAQGTAGATLFSGTSTLDATNQLAAPQITSVTTSAGSVTVGWTRPSGAKSFLVRVNAIPFTGVIGEKIVSGASTTATLTGLTLTTGANYQVNVFAFSQDVRTPEPLGTVFNISADNQAFVGP